MRELEKFAHWLQSTPWATEAHHIQAEAYLLTFPGRALPLLVELLEAAETERNRKMTESKGTISAEAFRKNFPESHKAWLGYCEARLQHEQMKESAAAAAKKFRGCETELIDAMLDEEVQGVPDEAGSYASMQRQWSIACNQDNREDVEEFLVEHFGDAETFKTFVLDKFAIQAKIRESCEDEEHALVEDELPGFLNLNTHPRLHVKGWEGKRREMEA